MFVHELHGEDQGKAQERAIVNWERNLWSYVIDRRRETKKLKTKSLLESTWKHRWSIGEWSKKVVYFAILSRACFIGSLRRMFITFCRNIQFPCNVIEFTRIYIKSFIFNWRQLPSWLFYYMLLSDGSISSQSCRPPARWGLHSPSRKKSFSLLSLHEISFCWSVEI